MPSLETVFDFLVFDENISVRQQQTFWLKPGEKPGSDLVTLLWDRCGLEMNVEEKGFSLKIPLQDGSEDIMFLKHGSTFTAETSQREGIPITHITSEVKE